MGDPVIVSLEFIDNSYAIGDILQDVAIYLRDDYLPYPKKNRTKGTKLSDIYIHRVVWVADADESYWDVITNLNS